MSDQNQEQFDIYIDYVKATGDASRVFHAMGELIDTFERIDNLLGGVISEHTSAELILEDIEAASLKAKLRSLILGVPDEALKDGKWKKVLGHFLVKAKYALCKWLEDNPTITNLGQVQILQGQIARIAEESGARHLPMYRPLDNKALLGAIAELDRAVEPLDPRDKVRYESTYGRVVLQHSQHIHEDLIRELLTKEILTSDDVRIVKIKKPDFLGRSQWVLKYAGRSINASISDANWLADFQSGVTEVKPGDSLRVQMHEEVFYGYNDEVVHVTYDIRKVLEVIKPRPVEQRRLTF